MRNCKPLLARLITYFMLVMMIFSLLSVAINLVFFAALTVAAASADPPAPLRISLKTPLPSLPDSPASAALVSTPDGAVLNATISVRGRSSQFYPKKGYSLQIRGVTKGGPVGNSDPTSLLGLDSRGGFALQAPYADASLLRNALGFQLASVAGMAGTPGFRFVDLTLEGETDPTLSGPVQAYRGVYTLLQKINIQAVCPGATSDDGAWLVEASHGPTDDYWDARLGRTPDAPLVTIGDQRFLLEFPDSNSNATAAAKTSSLTAGSGAGSGQARAAQMIQAVEAAAAAASSSASISSTQVQPPPVSASTPLSAAHSTPSPPEPALPRPASPVPTPSFVPSWWPFRPRPLAPSRKLLQAPPNALLNQLQRLLNVPAAIDYFLLTELSANPDAYLSSTFLYACAGDPTVRLGPVWDMDLSFGAMVGLDLSRVDAQIGWRFQNTYVTAESAVAGWYAALLGGRTHSQDSTAAGAAGADSDLVTWARIRARWMELRQGPWSDAAIRGWIEAQRDAMTASGAADRNFARWPVAALRPPKDTMAFTADLTGSRGFAGEVQAVIDFVTRRAAWMDRALEIGNVALY